MQDWFYDDLRQVGLDFEDEGEVETYDARQGGSAAKDAVLLERLGVGPGTAMADIGCGTGIMACQAAAMGAQVQAVDVSKTMLRAVERRTRDSGVALGLQHAGFLTFEASGLDLVTSKFALHHLPDFWKAAALVRIHDALKPGGRLYIEDVVFNCAPTAITATVEAWIDYMMAQTGYTREDVACHVRDEHSTFGWVLERLITEAGFTLLRASYEEPVYATYLAERPA